MPALFIKVGLVVKPRTNPSRYRFTISSRFAPSANTAIFSSGYGAMRALLSSLPAPKESLQVRQSPRRSHLVESLMDLMAGQQALAAERAQHPRQVGRLPRRHALQHHPALQRAHPVVDEVEPRR